MTTSREPKAKINTSRNYKHIQDSAPIAKHNKRVGDVVLVWNHIQNTWAGILCIAVNPKNLNLGLSLWNSLSSDTAQRDLAISASRVSFKDNKRLMGALEWAYETIGRLSSYRNAFVHSPMRFQIHDNEFIYVPNNQTTKPNYLNKINSVASDKEYKKLLGDLAQMDSYLNVVSFSLANPHIFALPKRPVLRLLQRTKGGGKKPHQRKAKADPRQP